MWMKFDDRRITKLMWILAEHGGSDIFLQEIQTVYLEQL